jgi:centrobin
LGEITTEGCIKEIDKFLNYSTPNNLSVQEFRPNHVFGSPSTKITATIEKPSSLLKLTDLWSNPNENCTSLQEERLRRQHLEKSVQALQTKLLEYQQKMVVAVKVDDDKNQIIDKMAIEKARFINTLAQYEEHIQHQQSQLQDQLKLASMVKDLQEKNNFLEQKMQSWTT